MGVDAVIPFVDEQVLIVSRGMTGATGNWYCGLHEPEEMGFALHFLRPGDLFVDVGANVGSYSVLALAAGAVVIAVEPVPRTFLRLQRNIAVNDASARVDSRRAGVAEKTGFLRFTVTHDTMNHVVMEGGDSAEDTCDVPVITLDELCDGREPSLLKIDVEGYELAVLRGGLQTLASHVLMAVIVETNQSGTRYGASDDDILQLMLSHGFAPARYDPLNRTLEKIGRTESGNTLFVRNLAEAAKRVSAGPEFKLINGKI